MGEPGKKRGSVVSLTLCSAGVAQSGKFTQVLDPAGGRLLHHAEQHRGSTQRAQVGGGDAPGQALPKGHE